MEKAETYEIEYNFARELYEILVIASGRCIKSSKSWFELDNYIKNTLGGY